VRASIEKWTALSEPKPIRLFQREGRLRAVAKWCKTRRRPPEDRGRVPCGVSKPKSRVGPAATPARPLRVPWKWMR